jgi:uncharacterized protein YraI
MNVRAACFQLVLLLIIPSTPFAQQFLEVTKFYAKVYIAPSATSQSVGVAQKGQKFQVIGTPVNSWYHINFRNSTGWVYKDNVQIGDASLPAAGSSEAARTTTVPQTPSAPKAVPPAAAAPQPPSSATPSPPPADTQPAEVASAPSSAAPSSGSAENTQPQRFVPPPQSNVKKSQPVVVKKTPSTNVFLKFFQKEKKKEIEEPQQQAPPPSKREAVWFTEQSFEHPTTGPEGTSGQDIQQRYFQVTFGSTPILTSANANASILGLARGGDLLPLVKEGNSWCKVVFGDSAGWIDHSRGKIVEAQTTEVIDKLKVTLVIVIPAALLIFILSTFLFVRSWRKRKIEKDLPATKNVLIIAKIVKVVQYTLTDKTTTLEKCFSEIGFNVTVARDLVTVKYTIDHTLPDVVMVDWHFDSTIHQKVEQIFAQRPSTSNALFLFYNIPDPSKITPSHLLPNANYLPLTFSDRDIFKLVTPAVIKAEKTTTIQKSVKSAALEGDLGGGNLLEVLQFVEIGSKSGCLMVEVNEPFGIVYFVQGRIVYATAPNGIIGREAVFAILNLKTGKFRFMLDKMPKMTNVNLSTLEVLMEWTQAIDEAHGH